MGGISRAHRPTPSPRCPGSRQKLQTSAEETVSFLNVPRPGVHFTLPHLSIVEEEVSLRKKAGKRALKGAYCIEEQPQREGGKGGRGRSASMPPGKSLKRRREKDIQPLILASEQPLPATTTHITHNSTSHSPPPTQQALTNDVFARKRSHRRSCSLSELISTTSPSSSYLFPPTPPPFPANQPWRSRDAWLALHGTPEPLPEALLPSAIGTAAGWKGKGGSTFFGADRVGIKKAQEGRSRKESRIANEPPVPSPPTKTSALLASPKPILIRGKYRTSQSLREPSTSSSSSSSYGTSSSYMSSPTRVFFYTQSLLEHEEQDELLPPLLPNRSVSSIPDSRPIPWGLASPLPSSGGSIAAPRTPARRRTPSSPLGLFTSSPRGWGNSSPPPPSNTFPDEDEYQTSHKHAGSRDLFPKRRLSMLTPPALATNGAGGGEVEQTWTRPVEWEVNETEKVEKAGRITEGGRGKWRWLLFGSRDE
ncbi:hypothetical protein IAR50_003575 [Cryptococcus sp. DSM 104548]